MSVKEKVDKAEKKTNVNPTEKQKLVGNYKKGSLIINGLKISIENPKGTTRSGISKTGNIWTHKMKNSYGYFNGTVGKDGDQIDVFLGDNISKNGDIYIVDQVDENTKSFDEHKVMMFFNSVEEAKGAYFENFEKGWKGFGTISTFSLSKFKAWIKNKDAIKYPASRLNMSKKIDFKGVKLDKKSVTISLNGEVIEGETLKDLKKQAGNESTFDSIVLKIASPGGSVSEGLEIMVWLDYLSQQGKEIITVVTANAYSIASLIMLAADIKIISKHGKVMVHNPMVPELSYVNANDLEKYTSDLRNLEATMYELYQIFTGLDKEQIKVLMDNETYLTPEDAIKNGFADMIIDIEPRPYAMAVNDKKQINMSKVINVLNKVISMVNQTDFVNQLYYTETGEIEIFQNDPATYQIGDRTSLKEGEVKLADGAKVKIEEFVITEIDKTIEEAVIEDEVAEGANEGPAPEEVIQEEVVEPIIKPAEEEVIPAKSKDEMPGKVIEKTESVTTTKETVAMEGPAPVEAKKDDMEAKVEVEAKVDEAEAKVEVEAKVDDAEAKEDIEAKVDIEAKKDAEMVDLKSVVKMLVEKVEALEAKQKSSDEFESVAAEAIDALATKTVTNFKPAAKAVAKEVATGSIFQKLKQKRGL